MNLEICAQPAGDNVAPPKSRPPTDDDLKRLLRFSPDSGAIWLGEHRMVLMDTQALSALRRDLLGSVGPEHTRRLLTRMGYACGRAMPNSRAAAGPTAPPRRCSRWARSCTCSKVQPGSASRAWR
jgi:hypothetical protein